MLFTALMKFLFGKGKENPNNPLENHQNNEYWDKTKEGKNPLIKGLINLNQWLNPNHDWFDYSDMQGTVDSVKDKYTGTGLTPAEQEANEFSSSEAQKSRDFEEYMARNKYSMETESMQNAGINPAMMYGGGNLVPTATNSATASSVSPNTGNLFDVISTVARLRSEINLADAQADEAKASAKEKEANAESTETHTAWIDRLNELEVESKKASTSLTKAQEGKVWEDIEVAQQEAHKLYEEAQTESERRLLYQSERALNDAKAWQIKEMVPYEKALSEAQTEMQKAQATLAFVNAAYQKGLIDKGYIDALVDNTFASANKSDAEASMTWFKDFIYREQNKTWTEVPDTFVGEVTESIVQSLNVLRQTIIGR